MTRLAEGLEKYSVSKTSSGVQSLRSPGLETPRLTLPVGGFADSNAVCVATQPAQLECSTNWITARRHPEHERTERRAMVIGLVEDDDLWMATLPSQLNCEDPGASDSRAARVTANCRFCLSKNTLCFGIVSCEGNQRSALLGEGVGQDEQY
jgi:hypothetical protein